MKKNFQTREYSTETVAGTFNMVESRAFFSSKILEIEDVMKVDENDIIWNEATDRTQGLGVDNENRSVDTFVLKQAYHAFSAAPRQSENQLREFPTWELSVDIQSVIINYLFGQLKRNNTFYGISNDKTSTGNIDDAIRHYIISNILPRIKFTSIDLYVKYYKIGEKQDDGQIALQGKNEFVESIITPLPKSGETTGQYLNRVLEYKKGLKVTNFQLTTNSTQSNAVITYKQIQNALNYKFDYYFDVIFEKA
jgi:hypothetical protein